MLFIVLKPNMTHHTHRLHINKDIHQQTEAMLLLRLEARYSSLHPAVSYFYLIFDLCLIDNLKVLTSLPTCNNISLLSLYPGGNIYVYENINEWIQKINKKLYQEMSEKKMFKRLSLLGSALQNTAIRPGRNGAIVSDFWLTYCTL